MKKLLTTLVILLAAAFAAAITRPEKEAHLDKIKEVISESIASELSLEGNGTPDDVSSLLGTLGSVGAFGHVFTFGKDQLLKAIKGGQ